MCDLLQVRSKVCFQRYTFKFETHVLLLFCDALDEGCLPCTHAVDSYPLLDSMFFPQTG